MAALAWDDAYAREEDAAAIAEAYWLDAESTTLCTGDLVVAPTTELPELRTACMLLDAAATAALYWLCAAKINAGVDAAPRLAVALTKTLEAAETKDE